MIDKTIALWCKPWHWIACGFGAGCLPKAPGTWGSLVALPFVTLLQMLSNAHYWLFLVLAFGFGVWLCGRVAQELGGQDPQVIVWDEIVGMWLTLWLVPQGWQWLFLGFLVFRLFDVLKPWPIRWIDQHVHGGLGIMLDDFLAAIFAWSTMHALVLVVL